MGSDGGPPACSTPLLGNCGEGAYEEAVVGLMAAVHSSAEGFAGAAVPGVGGVADAWGLLDDEGGELGGAQGGGAGLGLRGDAGNCAPDPRRGLPTLLLGWPALPVFTPPPNPPPRPWQVAPRRPPAGCSAWAGWRWCCAACPRAAPPRLRRPRRRPGRRCGATCACRACAARTPWSGGHGHGQPWWRLAKLR